LEERCAPSEEVSLIQKYVTGLSIILFLMAMAGAGTQAQDARPVDPLPPQQAARENGDGAGDRGQAPVLQHRNRRYQLHSADVLELNFPFTPEFNQTVTVQPDGYINLRGVEGIRVEGQTLPEVANSLRSAYARILHDPVINVELKDFEKPYFIVGGEVGRPGKFDLRGETTASEAVAIAGGLRESAKHSQVLLFHRVPDGWVQAKKLNMKKMLKDADLNEDAYLQPGDFLYVPKNAMSKIARFIPTSSVGLYANPGVL
jgi:polysaccharide biosynthesis/export protein